MIACRQNGVFYFKFHLLVGFPGLVHGVLTRLGGSSPAPFDSLNLSGKETDSPENVAANRSLASAALGLSRPICFASQVHGSTVVSLKNNETDAEALKTASITGDGLLTDIPGLPIAIQLADCQAILLHDPVRQVVGNVHAGWRGSVENIAAAAIRQMERDFGSDPADIRAAVSPSLGPCCGEFKHYQKELPQAFWGYRDSRDCFDFWAITRDQLQAAGIHPEHMAFAHVCTRCNDHLFFSYRKNPSTGRFAAVIGLAGTASN